jgi:hypothetical protein
MPIKDRFTASSDPGAVWKREGLPHPGRLARLGIRTKESLDWQAALHPQPPAPELHFDDADVEAEARENARREHRERINRLRAEFRDGAFKARQDFGTAREFRGQERERQK